MRAITEDGASVTVRLDGSALRADRVVVTVPLGVLKAGTVRFEPPLPEAKSAAIAGVGFSCVNKFLFLWDERFWDDADFLAHSAERRDLFNWFVNVDRVAPGIPALMTFAFADEALRTESLTDDEVVALVMVHLRDMHGTEVPPPRAMRRSRWCTDEWTRGAYSFTSTTTDMSHFDALAAAVGRVHFAGEHTERAHFSTVHGAYLSGLRAAREILGA